ncbi:MAG: hypothetical protein HOB92_03960 [Candidatus Cloacimonetes bacterium]|jgi:hypothetical protein|nr:hypothetical protein [Candidatus Cloacimonadota bacterium]MBT4575603.1 hypothetical protein [Candidatus Cloacimonadota bacterium]
MYPFDFKSDKFWLGSKHFFVAMPFNSDNKKIFTELIEPAVTKYSDDFVPWKADEDITTKVGWSIILEKLFSARLVIGVLEGGNHNVYYELGIAHSTQSLERQILLAPEHSFSEQKVDKINHKFENFKSPFDLQHLIYTTYDMNNLEKSIPDLVQKIQNQMKCLNFENDATIKRIIRQITPKEYELMVKHGDKHLSNGKDSSHFFPLEMDLVKYEAFCEMVKSGLLRFSVNLIDEKSYSYYWTYLGNAVLYSLDIISEEILKKRIKEYCDHEKKGSFLVAKNELNIPIPK